MPLDGWSIRRAVTPVRLKCKARRVRRDILKGKNKTRKKENFKEGIEVIREARDREQRIENKTMEQRRFEKEMKTYMERNLCAFLPI